MARHDFGTVLQGGELVHVFEVENTSSDAIELRGVLPVHGCSGSASPPRLPGKSRAELTVRCPAASHGALQRMVPVQSEPADAMPVEVELVATVTPRLAFDKPFAEFRLDFGATASDEVHAFGALLAEADLRLASPPAPGLSVEIAPKSSGRQRVTTRCRGAVVGVHHGELAFKTGLAEPAEIRLPYSCKVVGTLEVSPTNPYINLRVSGDKAVVVEVRSTQPGFAVRSAEIVDGPFSAAVSRDPDAVYRIKVSVLQAKLADETRSAVGTLRIVSNDRSEPRKELPLFGFGRLNRDGTDPTQAE